MEKQFYCKERDIHVDMATCRKSSALATFGSPCRDCKELARRERDLEKEVQVPPAMEADAGNIKAIPKAKTITDVPQILRRMQVAAGVDTDAALSKKLRGNVTQARSLNRIPDRWFEWFAKKGISENWLRTGDGLMRMDGEIEDDSAMGDAADLDHATQLAEPEPLPNSPLAAGFALEELIVALRTRLPGVRIVLDIPA
ncbi:MAG: hypothetical protein KKC99_07450 [Proteobacteria bacterium]|nr:hypothetical protein [Pseudomonadota bacterium]